MKVLYLIHASLDDPLPRAQGLPHVLALSSEHDVRIASFERHVSPDAREGCELRGDDPLRAEATRCGVHIHRLRWTGHRWLDILGALLLVVRLRLFWGLQAVHARSYVPAIVAWLARPLGVRLIFDMRGLMIDEFLAIGVWRPDQLKTRVGRFLEAQCLSAASAIIVTSKPFRDHVGNQKVLRGRRQPIWVIPNCVDVRRFDAAIAGRDIFRSELGFDGRMVIVYSGSLAGWQSIAVMRDALASHIRRDPSLLWLLLVYGAVDELNQELLRAGWRREQFRIESVPASDVPRWLAAADIGITFNQESLVRRIASPIKFAEYLAAGLPIIINRGVGDTEEVLALEEIGQAVNPSDPEEVARALDRWSRHVRDEGAVVRARCHRAAVKHLDFRRAVGMYRDLYRAVAAG